MLFPTSYKIFIRRSPVLRGEGGRPKILLLISFLYLFFINSLTAFAVETKDLLPPLGGDENSTDKLPITLPNGDIAKDFIPAVIKIMLKSAGTLVLLALVVSGVLFITAQGEEEKLGNAKKIVTYLVLGLIVIAVSYALVYGLASFSFY